MSFVDAFFSFQIELSDPDKGIFTTLRLKTPKHPYESLEHLFARLLAYVHCYRPGQTFTQGFYELREPTIWTKDVIGTLQQWIQVGPPDQKKLTRAARENNGTYYAIYFFEPAQQEIFCANLRGAREKWLDLFHLFQIAPDKVVNFAALAVNHSRWMVTIVDNILYLSTNSLDAEIEVAPLEPRQLLRQLAEASTN